jgi:hypothetical protein
MSATGLVSMAVKSRPARIGTPPRLAVAVLRQEFVACAMNG